MLVSGIPKNDLVLHIHISILFQILFPNMLLQFRASRVALVVKNLLANAGDVRDTGSIPGSGRSPAGRNGSALQYSCLENAMDRGAYWTTVHGFSNSQTCLSNEHTHVLQSIEQSSLCSALGLKLIYFFKLFL